MKLCMKIIIIEGTDNTGKDTVISKIIGSIAGRNSSLKIIHCSKPQSKDVKKAAMEQNKFFNDCVNNLIKDYKNNEEDILLFNRSWYGEYVYGNIYRNRLNIELLDFIKNLEKSIIENINSNDIFYIQLLSSSSALLNRNEDNLSLSKGDEEKIKTETQRFIDIFNNSKLKNKKLVYVNNGDEFRSREEIWNDIKIFCQL